MKVSVEKYGWLKDLYDNGYSYIMMPKKNRKEFFATKSQQKKDGTFRDSAKFDIMRLDKNEEWIPGDDTKNIYIHLDKPIKV